MLSALVSHFITLLRSVKAAGIVFVQASLKLATPTATGPGEPGTVKVAGPPPSACPEILEYRELSFWQNKIK
jgi:hypothetical protein